MPATGHRLRRMCSCATLCLSYPNSAAGAVKKAIESSLESRTKA
jgi:hypothetical protein